MTKAAAVPGWLVPRLTGQPSARVMYVWKILGPDAVLPIYHSLDEAMLGG